jgi:nucleotide-binding universal stress UspA family protein
LLYSKLLDKEVFMYGRILVPTDGSPCSERAVKESLLLAKELGSEITLLYVVEDPAYEIPRAAPYRQPFHDDLKQVGEQTLAHTKRWADDFGVTATTKLVEHQSAVEAIHAAEKDHDLTVIGTHGRRGFNRFAFGSVAEGVIRRAGKPCLVIRHVAPPT